MKIVTLRPSAGDDKKPNYVAQNYEQESCDGCAAAKVAN
jgi:hypothetical protein